MRVFGQQLAVEVGQEGVGIGAAKGMAVKPAAQEGIERRATDALLRALNDAGIATGVFRTDYGGDD